MRSHVACGFVFLLIAATAWALPDLNVVKTGPTQAALGDVLTYTLAYSNAGSVKSTSVVLQDFLPSNVTVLTNSLSGASLSGSTISWSIGQLNSKANGSKSFQVRVSSNASAYTTNRAQIFGAEAEEAGKTNDNYSTLVTHITNRPPVAVNDAYILNEGTMLTIAAPGILANDSDPEGSTLTVSLMSGPAHGILALGVHGDFSYTPTNQYSGLDSFTYRISDGQASSGNATVSLSVLSSIGQTNFCSAILTKQSIKLNGGILIDSFNPSDPAKSTNGRYDPAKRQEHGNIASSSDTVTAITETGSAKVYGRAATSPTGKIIASGLASIGSMAWVDGGNRGTQPGWASSNLIVSIPDVQLPSLTFSSLAKISGNVGGTNYTCVLTNGNYRSTSDFSLSSSENMVIVGNVVLNFQRKLSLSGSAYIYITPGSKLTVYLADDSQLAGGGIINGTGDARNCGFFGLPTCPSVAYSGNSGFVGTIYAPQADAKLSGGGSAGLNFIGALVANNVDVGGSYQFHYDESLCERPNRAPVANNDFYSTPEDTLLIVPAPGVLANDGDFDGDPLTAILVGNPARGTVSLNTNGGFLYLPANDYNGPDSFTYKVNDGAHDSGIATVAITVTPVNDPPIAADDGYITAEDTALIIAAPGVLANDSDADGDILRALLANGPSHGTLTLNTNGGFTYTPTNNYNGPDSFTYKASDAQTNSAIATVSITITPVNDRPVALNDNYTTPEDTALDISAPGVLANDSDADGDTLTAMLVSGPTHGTLALRTNGGFDYVPATNYSGPDSFTYKALDALTNSAVATVSITVTPVNDVPIALNDAYSTPEDTVLNVVAPGVLANDSDADGDPLKAVLIIGPAYGTLTLSTNGSFVYTPTNNYKGPDSFSYKACDPQSNSAVATVSITVTPVNDPPAAANDSYTTSEDTAMNISAPGVLANDSDPDGDALSAFLINGPTHGTLTLNTNGGFVYTPTNNYNGPDSFTYKASDGVTNSAVATVSITVSPVNDPPIALDDSYTTVEDTALNISAPGVLANDSDADGDALKAKLVAGPAHGTLTLNTNGGFIYTPGTNYSGPDSFTYKACDSVTNSAVATVSITVTPVNDVPIALNDSYTTLEDTALNVSAPGILANDTDADGDALSALLVSGPAHGTLTLNTNGGFVYTPTTNYNGPDSFTYKASDGLTNSAVATVSITVTPANDLPVALDDSYTTPEDTALNISAPGVLSNDSDPDGDALKAKLVSGPAHGTLTLNTNGGFVYTPTNNYNGSDSFTYKACDAQTNSATATVNITVTPVNDPPVAANDSFTTPKNVPLDISAPGVLANDSDADGDALKAILVSGTTHGTLTLNTNGSFLYTPTKNYSGPDGFTYKAYDAQTNSAVATVSITVTPANNPPVATNDNYTTPEDTALNIAAPGVLSNDTDADDDVLAAALVSGPSHGALSLSTNGGFVYTPATNYNGPDSFTYKAFDALTNSDVATVSITVTPRNDPPDTNNWTGGEYTVLEDATLIAPAPGVLAGITDVDGDVLSSLLVSNTLHGTLTLNTNGSFIYTPETNYNGPDSFQFSVSDGQVVTAPLLARITVVPVNDAPSFSKGANQLVQQNVGVQTISSWASNISPGPANEATQTVTFQVNNNNNALFSTQPAISTNGTLTYTPALNAYGVATVTAAAHDDGGAANGGVDTSTPQTFTITVNSPPAVSILSPTNGAVFFAPADFIVLASATDPDGTVAKVDFLQSTNNIGVATNGEPYYVTQTNVPVGTLIFGATATDNLGAIGSAIPVTVSIIERPPLSTVTALHYNPQTDFFETRVRVTNPTLSLLNGVRVSVLNLTNSPAITVHNSSGYTNGIPYVQTSALVPPGSYVDMTIEFYSPLRIAPNPILRAELTAPLNSVAVPAGLAQRINRILPLANKTVMVEFLTQSNRIYSLQYSTDMVTWKAAQPVITGNGNWVQWIDNGLPKTDGAPGSQRCRFYRVVLLP